MTDNTNHAEINQAIALEAVLSKISTTVDGGWNVTFSASQSEAEMIMKLSALRDTPLQLAVVPINNE